MAKDFVDYAASLTRRLAEHNALARKLIAHQGEKGRVVESTARTVLQDILPGRFRIGSGFITNSNGDRSKQIDIVIYDGLENAPIFLDGGIGVFPIECVYGVVEVKSTLEKRDVDSFSESVAVVRKIAKTAKYYSSYYTARIKPNKGRVGGSVKKSKAERSRLAPRAYLLAYASDTDVLNTLKNRFVAAATEHASHVHGILVLKQNWFLHQRAFYKAPTFSAKQSDGAFVDFHLKLLHGLQSIRMRSAYLRKYFKDIEDEED